MWTFWQQYAENLFGLVLSMDNSGKNCGILEIWKSSIVYGLTEVIPGNTKAFTVL